MAESLPPPRRVTDATLLMGIPATGKTSFYLDRLFRTHLRLNRSVTHTRAKELRLFDSALEAKVSVVVDDTNVTRAGREKYLAVARGHQVPVVGYYFESKLAPALRRNARRRKPVPEIALRVAFDRLELPSWGEGFSSLYYVKLIPEEPRFAVSPWHDEPELPLTA